MSRRVAVVFVVAYIVMLAAVVGGMLMLRERTLAKLDDNVSARQDWQVWRDEAARQAKSGPVQRRVPKSAEPPALVLMRDYFLTMLSGAVLFSSLLFATALLVLRGIFSGPPADSLPRR